MNNKYQRSNVLDKKLEEIKQKKKIGLMMHIVVGYPSLDTTIKLVSLMEKCGVDMVELQIPFSDPLADGPTIMQACEQSLKRGTKVKDVFKIVKKLHKHVNIPLLVMCYYNTVFAYGVEKFCRDCALVGVSGLIVPDMPIDEEKNEHFYFFAKKYGLHTIQVISPITTDDRLKIIAKFANGFVYCAARQGITGVYGAKSKGLRAYLKQLRKYFSIPIAVGFGISKKEHVQLLIGKSTIAVIGSKLLNIINESKDYMEEIEHFLKQVNMVEY